MRLTLLLAMLFSILRGQAEEPVALKLIKTVPLSGVEGRFDHFAIDVAGQRVFVAALGNNTLEIVNIATGRHIKSITGLHKPTGVIYIKGSNQIAVANGDDGTVRIYDADSHLPVKTIPSLDDADNLRLDAESTTMFAGYGEGALGIIDMAGMGQTGSIKLDAHPESFQLERQGTRIFVNVPGARQVAVVDRVKKTILATLPMTRYTGNFPMALDEVNHRLFVGCRSPSKLVVLDTSSGKEIAALKISDDTDDLFYDMQRHRLYVSCGEGFVDVFNQRDADHYELQDHVATRRGARTSFFSPELSRLIVAVPKNSLLQAELRIFSVDR